MNSKCVNNVFNEDWSRWDPGVKGLEGSYYIGEVYDGCDFFKVSLSQSGTDQEVEMRFPHPILASRHINESLCFLLYGELHDKYGLEFNRGWSFFKVKNSDFLRRLAKYSSGLSMDVYKLQHFAILAGDCILDIAASDEPEFTILPSLEFRESLKGTVKYEKGGVVVNWRNYSKDGQSVYEVFKDATSVKQRGVEE